ncbi:hypothetical protein [Priestia aryabhattai]|uniref:hypothetical protein n=1 Tax=Priestia aryabhattai TaxID=412384 RepID=UPI003D265C68
MRPRRNASDEEAQRPPAESEVLHGNQLSQAVQLMYAICASLNSIHLVMSKPLFLF